MTQSEFFNYISKNYCPHDILRGMEPNTKRCDQLMNDYREMGCTFCWVITVTEMGKEGGEE